MTPRTAFYSASGPRHDDCYALAQRWDDERPYSSNWGEFWEVTLRAGTGALGCFDHHLMPAVWRSPSGACFVAGSSGVVHHHPDPRVEGSGAAWTRHPVPIGGLMGLWGLADDCVFAYGIVARGPEAERNVVCRWDGARWVQLPSPGFRVHAMHGLAPDLAYAVGHNGGVALWDGGAWRMFTAGTNETLTAVFVATPDEIYATGFQGSVLEGSAAGWGRIAEGPRMGTGEGAPLVGVARWRGELWIGGGYDGLMRRIGRGNRLEVVAPKVHAMGFDARETLVIVAPEAVWGTADGVTFAASGEDYVLTARAGYAIHDVPDDA